MYAVGLMSGTSLDGIDAVLCDIEGSGMQTKINELAFLTLVIPLSIKDKIHKCCANELIETALICSLNFELGEIFADAVLAVCDKAGIHSSKLGFVASHGQTIQHIPHAYDTYIPSTLQIGESAILAQRCHCPIISNFRSKDMAVHGEGAPLVPFSEFVLYHNDHKTIALQNIGGIGNVTILPGGGNIDDVFAFDTGPGNMMIDEAMKRLYGVSYDVNGNIASQGKLVKAMQTELMQHSYIKMKPPKSTGREQFGVPITAKLLERYKKEQKADVITTLTWFTAYTIAESYRRYVLPCYSLSEVILGGGGAHNFTLRTLLQQEIADIPVVTQEDKGYSSDAKEAIAFVILGNETLHHQYANLPNATGANQKVILGNITYPD